MPAPSKSNSSREVPGDAGTTPRPDYKIWSVCSCFLLLIWAAIYLPHLRSSPRWYGDEFITLMTGDSIWDGTFANRALRYTFFSGSFTNYQPAGCFLYAAASHIFSGGDILGARILAAILGFLTAFAAFHLLFLRGLIVEGVSAALIVLSAPESVIHFRWVYPHYFVSIGVVIIGLVLDLPRTARRDWIIGLSCACAALGHLLALHVTVAALIVRWRYPGAWLRILLPPATVLLLSLGFSYLISGDELFADLHELLFAYTTHTGNGLLRKLWTFWQFFTWDWVHLLYIAGLVILAVDRRWALVVFASLISFAVLQNRPELPIFYYQAMIFAPLLGVCLACGLQVLYRWLLALDPKLVRMRSARVILAAIIPGILLVQALPSSFGGKLVSRNDPWVAPSDKDLELTAAWVNANAGKDDLVVAFWDIGWLLNKRWTDLTQCAVWQYGSCPLIYQRQRDHSEFLFPADLTTAHYVVVGQLDVRWTASQGTVPQLIQYTDLQHWPVVAKTDTTFVLENPRFRPKTSSP
jgi:hypothetical protein